MTPNEELAAAVEYFQSCIRRNRYPALVEAATTVLAALEKAQADSARIDWLSKCGTPETFEDAPHSTVWHIIGNLGQRDLRAAIDAAMKGTT